jgi:superfamily II DNA or RNA helicase
MKVIVDSWAWLDKASLSELQLARLRTTLTVVPRKAPEYPGEDPGPLYLYTETPDLFGVAREYFLANKKPNHEYVLNVSGGDKSTWPGDLTFSGKLREEQARAIAEISGRFKHGGLLGGMLKAAPGWGKTVASSALIAEMQVPTLVVVHKEFLMAQWRERLEAFLPGVKLGLVQQDECTYLGCHVVMAMVHTLANKTFPEKFIRWPGLVITDECHRTGAKTWSVVPAKFPARWRLGITATPRRKDGAEKVFQYHLGEILFSATEQRLKPKIRRVHTTFQVMKTPNFNPALMNKSILLKFLCANQLRNRVVAMQVVMALQAGRKVLVLSERLNHLEALHKEIEVQWGTAAGPCPGIDYYVGGRKELELARASKARVILATSQYAQEGLDIPALDTLVLSTPLSDVEQAVGRILRPFEGKKDPIVVDIRDDKVGMFRSLGTKRDVIYQRMT